MTRALRKADKAFLRQVLNRFNHPHELPDIPDRVFLSFFEYHQSISEYNSMTSQYDPATYLDATMDQPLTARPALTPGDYLATIGELKAESWTKKDDASKSGMKFNVGLKIQVTSAEEQARQGSSEVTLFDTIFLDTTPSGGLDMSPGKNNQLRRYRVATKLNEPGQSFKPSMMTGRQVKVRVINEPYQGEMKDRVDSVASV